MPVDLHQMRELLLPGLIGITAQKEFAWNSAFAKALVEPVTSLPPVSLPTAVAMGAAAVVMKNPVVKRRFWAK